MKDVTHLTAATYQGLLRGDLRSEEARALARHLEEPCRTCEAFLADLPAADGLDGRADAALGALGPGGAPGNDLEFARIERRLRQGSGARRRPVRLLAGAAAAVLLAGLAGLLLPRGQVERPAWDGIKGEARAMPARLRFLVVAPDAGGRPGLEKGVPGQAVSDRASLQFEVEIGRAASAAIVRVSAREAPEVVWKERVGTGRTTVSLGGRPAAYSLSGLSGVQRFVLLASEEGLDAARLDAAARALAPPAPASAKSRALEGLSLDLLEVEVR